VASSSASIEIGSDVIEIGSDVIIQKEIPEKTAEASQKEDTNTYTEPLVQLDKIMKNVKNLEQKVDTFNGAMNSKEFASLEEALGKTLLDLDGIKSNGMEYIQRRRKEIVDFTNVLISNLQSKSMETVHVEVKELPTISTFIEEALAPAPVSKKYFR
jgi:pyruvate-formate lyase-activating enzyme